MSSTSVLRSTMFAAALMASAVALAQPPVKVAPPDSGDRARPQGFSVVLVLGDSKSGAPGDDNLPAAARKALADMKDFLPYKSYRMLDVQWILGSDRATTRLRGVDEQEYQLTLRSSPYRAPSSLSVMFQLQEAGAADAAVSYDDRQRRAEAAAKGGSGVEPYVAVGRGRGVIDTSFTMEIGETVVVGTSRVRGGVDNRALIALLTAVPKSGATRKD